jgi:hypothetical protein
MREVREVYDTAIETKEATTTKNDFLTNIIITFIVLIVHVSYILYFLLIFGYNHN